MGSRAMNQHASLQAVHDLLSLDGQELVQHLVHWDEPRSKEAREAAKRVLWVEISKLERQLGIRGEE